jgi:nucleoside-diphosphate-sugar epimerase
VIFILGGAGFIGSALVRHCRRHNLEHAVITRESYRALAGQACDVLINANGNSRKFLAAQDPLAEFQASVASVRASLVDFPAERYVHISTCDVYPDCTSPATTVETLQPEPAQQSPYGFHKYLAEQCVRHAARRWLILRFGGVVGPGLKKNPIYDILHGGPLWLDPASELQYLHTDDAAAIIFALLARGLSHEIFNLCGQGTVQLAEVMTWADRQVPVQPGSPTVRYDVAVAKLAAQVPVPESRQTVRSFVAEALRAGDQAGG